MLPQISVVIPVFNAEKYLSVCLDALLKQDYPADRYEVIVVNNNSTDDSVAIVGRHQGPKLLHEPKQGSYAARNAGVWAAEGDIIAFLDPDCLPVPGWLTAFAQAMDEEGRDIVLGMRTFESPSSRLQKLANYDTVLAEWLFSSDIPSAYFGYSNNMAVRRSLFDTLGQFREVPRGADTAFVYKAVESYGCEIVGYDASARVAHLEIQSVTNFYCKRFVYGTSNSRLSSMGIPRSLTMGERFSIYRRAVERCDYSLPEAIELLVLLSFGVGFYAAGRLRGRLP